MPSVPYVQREPYATPDDLVLTLPAAVLERVEYAQLIGFLCAASDIVDGYFACQYIVPIPTWAYDVRLAVCQIAAVLVLRHIGYNPQGSDEGFQRGRDEAIAWLEKVSTGRIKLSGGSLRAPEMVGGPVFRSTPQRGW